MPVEIRELVIKAITTSEDGSSEQPPECEMTPEEREAIIQECVRQVLRILQKQKER